MKTRLKDFKLEKMKRLMNLSNYKDFLMQNVDEQCEWPQMMQQKIQEKGRELQEKIASVNQKKETLQEENRKKLIDHSKRWEVYKIQQAIEKEKERDLRERQRRKKMWIAMILVHDLMKNQFLLKYQ